MCLVTLNCAQSINHYFATLWPVFFTCERVMYMEILFLHRAAVQDMNVSLNNL